MSETTYYQRNREVILNRAKDFYFYNDLINIKSFNSNNLRLDKKSVLGNDVYYIE